MANTLTNLQNIRIADAFLKGFVARVMPITAFSTNFGPKPLEKGKTVTVPIVGAPGGSTQYAGTYKTNSTSAPGTQVTLDKHYFQAVELSDLEAIESEWPTIERLAINKGQKLAQDVITDVFSLITDGNYSTAGYIGATNTFDADAVLTLRGVCAKANMPLEERSLIVNDEMATTLLGDDRISRSYNMQIHAPGFVEGTPPRFYGFNFHECTFIPHNSQNLCGFAAHPSGIAVAMRYLPPLRPEAYIEAGPVTDPGSGITLGYRRFYDVDSGTEYAAIECLYGYAKGVAAGIKRITTA